MEIQPPTKRRKREFIVERDETGSFSGLVGAVSLNYGDTTNAVGGSPTCQLSTRRQTIRVITEEENSYNNDPTACVVPNQTVYLNFTPMGESTSGKGGAKTCGLPGGETCRYNLVNGG